MFFRCVFFLVVFGMCVGIHANNVIYVIVEGASRHTLYPLIERGKLPAFNKIIQRGNFRNVSVEDTQLLEDRSTKLLYSGMVNEVDEGMVFVDFIRNRRPNTDVKCFFSTPLNSDLNESMTRIMEDLIQRTNSPELVYRTSQDTSKLVTTYLDQQETPFFVMLNFTNVNYIGWRYREGAELYAKAFMNVDRALGRIIDFLEQKGLFEDTEFLLTTNYGYARSTPEPEAKGWIVASRKALRKGTLNDIIPSLFHMLNIDDEGGSFNRLGTTLF